MQQVPLHEAAQQLSDLVDAAVRGEVVLITTDDHQTVRLVPINHSEQRHQSPARATWAEQFKKLAEAGEDELLDGDIW